MRDNGHHAMKSRFRLVDGHDGRDGSGKKVVVGIARVKVGVGRRSNVRRSY